MRFGQISALRRFGKPGLNEIVDEVDCRFAIPFAERVVIEAFQNMPLLDAAAEILEEAGFPAGTFNVVTHAPGEAGKIADVFFESRAVRCINFTGSDRTARLLAERAGGAAGTGAAGSPGGAIVSGMSSGPGV